MNKISILSVAAITIVSILSIDAAISQNNSFIAYAVENFDRINLNNSGEQILLNSNTNNPTIEIRDTDAHVAVSSTTNSNIPSSNSDVLEFSGMPVSFSSSAHYG